MDATLRRNTEHCDPEGRIEAEVQARRTAVALPLIRAYARSIRRNPTKLARACDWYRRLGYMTEGLALTEPKTIIRRNLPADGFTSMKLLWATRFLNLMGASAYAIELVRRITPVSWCDHRIIGNIYLANFKNDEALKHFKSMRALCPVADQKTYAGRLSLLDYADALFATGHEPEALALVAKAQGQSPEPYAQAMCLQVHGEYLARSGKFAEAQAVLEESLSRFPVGDATVDRGFCLKWLAYAVGKQGDKARARKLFAETMTILKRGEYRAEAWRGVQRLQEELGLVPVQKPSRKTTHRPALTIDLSADEWFQGDEAHLGLTLELKLLALIAQSGDDGVTLHRLKPLLWPDQLYAYSLLDERLRKLLKALEQKFKVRLANRDGFLAVTKPTVAVIDEDGHRPRFLRETLGRPFTAQEMGRYYGLQRTHRAAHLKKWMVRGWITREGCAQRPLYRAT